jgi:putative membrane protein
MSEALNLPFVALKALHFVGVFMVVAAVFTEWVLLKPVLSRAEIMKLARIDGIYGAGAILVLAAGLTLWLTDLGRPAEFYTRNSYLYIKLGVFSVIGLLSIYPTVWFMRNRKGDASDLIDVPRVMQGILLAELLLLLTMPLWAVMMVYA